MGETGRYDGFGARLATFERELGEVRDRMHDLAEGLGVLNAQVEMHGEIVDKIEVVGQKLDAKIQLLTIDVATVKSHLAGARWLTALFAPALTGVLAGVAVWWLTKVGR